MSVLPPTTVGGMDALLVAEINTIKILHLTRTMIKDFNATSLSIILNILYLMATAKKNKKDYVISVCDDCICVFSGDNGLFCPDCGGANHAPVGDDLPF